MSSGYVTHVTGTLFRTRNTICWTVRMNILSAFAHSNTVLFSNQLDWTQHDITPGQSHTQCPPHNARERGCKHWPIQAQRERGHELYNTNGEEDSSHLTYPCFKRAQNSQMIPPLLFVAVGWSWQMLSC
jgi:hypothetical protein